MSDPNTVDVLIIGAGPTGATAAYILAREGLDVLILDKARFPRPKICGGLITWKTVRILKEIFDVSPQYLSRRGILFHETRKYSLHNRNRLLCRHRQQDPFYFIDRPGYDHLWLETAVAAGAEFVDDKRVTAADPDTGVVRVDGEKTYQGEVIIGADGVFSRVKAAVMKGVENGRRPYTGMALAMVAHMSGRNVLNAPELTFGYVPWGYAWSFPGPGYRNYGMLTLKERGAKRLRTAFHEFLTSNRVDGPPISISSRQLPYGCFIQSAGRGRTLLVGDACGLADPFLGEGIFYAHQSGRMAAEAVISGRRLGGLPLHRYRDMLRGSIIYELRFALAWQYILYRLLRLGDYRLLGVSMRHFHKPIENVVQGRRSFNWRHRNHQALFHAHGWR